MKIHICPGCHKTAITSRRKTYTCIKCQKEMIVLPIRFEDWWYKKEAERKEFIEEYFALPPSKRKSHPPRKKRSKKSK